MSVETLSAGEDVKPVGFFDLSFRGKLPTLLRAIADRIDAGETHAEAFDWSLTKERLIFTATLDLDEVKK